MSEPQRLDNQVLATKLLVPRIPRALIARPRLEGLLYAGLDKKLTLVAAPAGFGKTTLLATWAATVAPERASVAWVSLDAADNDQRRFWLHLLSALDRQPAGRMQPALAPLQHGSMPSTRDLLTLTINALVEAGQHSILILDDYHLIGESAVHDAVALLLERLPPQLHLVLATRTTPPFPLARLRAGADIQEVREDDLRCTADEAAQFLSDVMGLRLVPADVATVAARTEGWLVGLQLIGLWLQRNDTDHIIEELRGSHRYILDYVTEQVLAQQAEPIRRFLLATAVLDQLSADLCAAVAGDLLQPADGTPPAVAAQQFLETLERANLFVTALDGQRQWYRYHALFAEALRYHLEQEDATLALTLHRRASRWYAEHGRRYEAMQHAILSRDWEWAADLAQEALNFTYSRPGETPTLLRWIEQLPDEIVSRRPHLFQAYVTLLLFNLRYDQAYRLLDTTDDQAEVDPLRGWKLAVHAFQRATFGEVAQATLLITQARQHLVDDDHMGQAALHSAHSNLMEARGMAQEAVVLRRASIADIQRTSNGQLALMDTVVLSRQLRLHGRLHEAWQTAQQVVEHSLQLAGNPSATTGHAFAQQAGVLCEWNRLDEALDLARQAVALAEKTGYLHLIPVAQVELIAVQLARGAFDDAAIWLEQQQRAQFLQINPFRRSYQYELWQVRFWLACGEIERAAQWAETVVRNQRQEAALARDREDTTRSRVALAQRNPAVALELLAALLPQSRRQERWCHVIEQLVLKAVAHAMDGDQAAALAALAEALRIGAPEGYIRTFVDEGPEIAELLRHLPATSYRNRVLAAFSNGRLPVPSVGLPGNLAIQHRQSKVHHLLESLTERESEVLQLLARGATNQEIAAALIVAPSTVKNHLSRIFGKLGVGNRTQAVAQARILGLLDES